MTNKLLKFVSFVTALCVLLGVMSVMAFAVEPVYNTGEIFTITQFSPEADISVDGTVSANKFYSNSVNVDTTKYFYNQLTANQKAIYDAVWVAGPSEQVRVNISTSSSSAAQQDVMIALSALNEDNPLFFWLSKFGCGRASSYIIVYFYLFSLYSLLFTKH